MTTNSRLPGIGVCVGRFQTPYLHDGHLRILMAVNSHEHGIVFVGVPGTPMTKKNPLDFATRKMMLQKVLGNHVWILPINDHSVEATWSKNLDANILDLFSENNGHSEEDVVFYHGRDSFQPYYSGQFKKFIRLEDSESNATDLRNKIATNPCESEDFRRGVIYASQNMFPRVQPTVDIAPIYWDNTEEIPHVLIARKPGKKTWCFVGGFMDMTDTTAESAAARELEEETGLKLRPAQIHFMKYMGAHKINDWRDTPSTSVMTTFFCVEVDQKQAKSVRANDDVEEVKWVKIGELNEQLISKSHHVLMYRLLKFSGKFLDDTGVITEEEIDKLREKILNHDFTDSK
jgi:bifunctional NMN adenylyltransferase/nudix hydrolase